MKSGMFLHDPINPASFMSSYIEDRETHPSQPKVSERVSNTIYYTYTIGLFTLEVICAILIDDVTLIFGFVAAITESMLNFIIPASFYLISLKLSKNKPDKILQIGSYVFIFLGVSIFVALNYHNILKIKSY